MRLLKTLLIGWALLLALPADAADLWRPKGQPAFVNQNGKPLANAKLCFFDAGTSDQATVYKDSAETIPWAQPIDLNSAGALSDPIYVPAGAFKEVFLASDAADCDGGTVLFTDDNIPGALDLEALGVGRGIPERPVLSRADDYTVAAEDFGSIIDVDATSNAVTISLIGAANGDILTVRKRDGSANQVIVETAGVETIDGQSAYTLSLTNETVTVASDGSSWRTIDTPTPGTVAFNKLADAAWDDDPTLAADSDEVLPTQGAVKAYVDAVATAGVKWRSPVEAATTAPGTLASDFEDGDTIDDFELSTSDRILVKNQSDATENGIYVVEASGAPTRAADNNEDAEIPGSTVLVRDGTVNGNTTWANNNEIVEIGVTSITFVQTAGSNVYTADGSTLELNGQQFRVKDLGIATGKIANLGVTEGKIAGNAVSLGKLATDVQNRLMQVGTVFDYVGTSCPAYSVEPYGQTLSAGTYPALCSIVGSIYGGSCRMPDLRGRVVAGPDNMGGTPANRVPGAVLATAGGEVAEPVQQANLALFGLPHGLTLPDHIHVAGTYAVDPAPVNATGVPTVLWRQQGGGVSATGGGAISMSTVSPTITVDIPSTSVTGTSGNPASSPAIDGAIASNLGEVVPLSKMQPTIFLRKCIHTGV